MARGIAVYRRAGGEAIYDEPLGSESAVREWWSDPAAALGLPLIASIYDHGFYHGMCWAGTELEQVLAELARLQDYWSSIGLPPDVTSDLASRASCLRAAISLAKSCDGFVSIS